MKQTLLILFSFFIFGNSFSQEKQVIETADIDTQKIDSLVSHIENNDRGIGSVSIFKDGKEIYNRSFGQSKLTDIQYNAETKYRIGSITKMITATLVFKLIENNQLSLADKLSKFYPKIPNSEKITIKNLLEHSSGLGDFVMKNDSITWLIEKANEKEIFDEIIKQGVSFQPSENVAYSNSGYFLLAKIVENLFGKDYAAIVAENIAQPLKLKNLEAATEKTKNLFPPYGYKEKWEKVKDLEFSNIIGVGDVVATTKDLNSFLYNLFQYKILKKESLEQMKPNYTKEETFGRGLMFIPFYENVFYGHAGDTSTTHSVVAYNQKDSLGLSLALIGDRFPRNDFIIGILSIVYGKDYEFPNFRVITLNSEDLDKFLGTYSSPDYPLKLTISKDGNTLMGKGEGAGQSAFPLECYEENKFKFDRAGVKIEFIPEENKLIMNQNGEKIEMTKE